MLTVASSTGASFNVAGLKRRRFIRAVGSWVTPTSVLLLINKVNSLFDLWWTQEMKTFNLNMLLIIFAYIIRSAKRHILWIITFQSDTLVGNITYMYPLCGTDFSKLISKWATDSLSWRKLNVSQIRLWLDLETSRRSSQRDLSGKDSRKTSRRG